MWFIYFCIKAKSCVFVNGELSITFPCPVGVKQGDSLSPLLFAIYLSDLNTFFPNILKN